MAYPISMNLEQKTSQSIKQLQRMIMSQQMQQAINLLQMPVMELMPVVELELQQNPVLECVDDCEAEEDLDLEQLEAEAQDETISDEQAPETELSFDENDLEALHRMDDDFRDCLPEGAGESFQHTAQQDKLQTFLESSICEEPTLFKFLMNQAQDVFQTAKELAIAESIIGNFDQFGYLSTPLAEIATFQVCKEVEVEHILKIVQTFHPPGIGARDLRESLLIQLRHCGKENTLAYEIIEKKFDDFLHNRIHNITKSLHCTPDQVTEMIAHIAKLDLHPGTQFSRQAVSYISPDVSLQLEGDHLQVMINDEFIPRLRFNRKYLKMLEDESLSVETRNFIRQKIGSAKWLLRNLSQRNSTLEAIAQSLIKYQNAFFATSNGHLAPLTMKTIAAELGLHESTIARAVSNKYINTPRGLFPLRFFFTSSLHTSEGEDISAMTARDMIMRIISNEDVRHPLSDESISQMLQEKGVQCARRTVAKYRTLLNLGSASQRRKF